MQMLQPFRQRVQAARKAEFAAAAATRAAQRALVQEEVGSGLKRRKVEADEEDANWKEWAHSDWTRQETWTQNRRKVEMREGVNVLPPRVASLASSTTGGVAALAGCKIGHVAPSRTR